MVSFKSQFDLREEVGGEYDKNKLYEILKE